MPDAAQKKPKKYTFKAEVKRLLDILVHSVYTSKDIFIRELISNAADALEKVRFAQLEGDTLHSPDAELQIRIEAISEPDRKALVISDTGIGMTLEEARHNLGTIAHSGALDFLERVKGADKADLSLIGRFGIGFYSVFMVANTVTVTTRSAEPGASAVVWRSDGLGNYSVEQITDDVPRGTRVEIDLKEEDGRFADASTVEAAIRKYSNFVPFPILVNEEQKNKTGALWREQPTQVVKEQYKEFFHFLTGDLEDPLLELHFSTDSPLQFSALLFVPTSNPEALGFGESEVRLQLYVKRVLIDGENKDLLPGYLRFVRGVVESEDLPLNISRETLQENRLVMKIREVLTRQLLDQLLKLAERDPQEYLGFWRTFGRFVKEGYADFANRDRIQRLLRMHSSHGESSEQLTSLPEYVERMPETQKTIYYLTGASVEALQKDPRLELFRRKGIEVLYLVDVADEFALAGLGSFQEHPLLSADQVKPEDLEGVGPPLGDDSDKPAVDPAALQSLIETFKGILGDRVTDIRVSERLVESPACLVNPDAMSGHMERMIRFMNKSEDLPRRILELNPRHDLIAHLARLREHDPDEPFIRTACEQLFEGAMLTDGYLTDPHELVERMNRVLEEAAALKVGTKT